MMRNVLLPSAFLLWWSASSATGFGSTLSFLPSSEVVNYADVAERKIKYQSGGQSNSKPLDARGGQGPHLRQRLTLSSSSDTAVTLSVKTNEHLARLGRCSMAFVGCLITVGLRNEPRISAIVASALTGLMACGVGYAPVAAFCGSFAGMSTHVSSMETAWPMALAVSTIYGIFDAKKLLVGVGGRLGLIALLSNLFTVSVGLVDKVGIQAEMLGMVQKVGGWKTTGSLAVLIFMTKLISRIPAVKGIPTIKMVSKTTMMVLLAFTSVPYSTAQLKGLASSFIAVYVSTMIIQEADGVVFPVALLGLLGALVLPQHAAAIYLGGFIGMSSKPKFRSGQAAQASFVAAVLLVSGLWNGLGGRLGTQAAVSVLFSLM